MKTLSSAIINAAVVMIATTAVVSGNAWSKEIVLPEEKIAWRESPLPGYQKVLQECSICHSAHYAEYQPTSTSRNYWEAQVKRMKTVFNAPIPDEDIPLITDYLANTYNVEKRALAQKGGTPATTPPVPNSARRQMRPN